MIKLGPFYLPSIKREEELEYYQFLFHANFFKDAITSMGLFLLSMITCIYSITQYIYGQGKQYLYAGLFSLFCFVMFFVLTRYINTLKNNIYMQNKKAFILFYSSFNMILLTIAFVYSQLESNMTILYSILILVAIVHFVPPKVFLIQYLWLLLLYICYEYTIAKTLVFFPFLFHFCLSLIVSYTVHFNKVNEYLLYKKLKKQAALLEASNRELSQFSYSDALTGVNNRRRIDDILKENWNYCKSIHEKLSLVFIDLDHFKKYNDFYGHIKGDECLIKVANAIDDYCTHFVEDINCYMGRYGGEEFVMILPKTKKEKVISIANELCKEIAALQLPHEKNNGRGVVTISCGATSMIPSKKNRLLHMLETADRALYYRKHHGRNGVTHFDDIVT